jgi:ribonuclease PH
VGIINGTAMLDLAYDEDSRADVDMNVVMTSKGKFIEIQGTAERQTFDKEQLDALLRLAKTGIEELITIQKNALKDVL